MPKPPPKVSSLVTPTERDLAVFKKLSPDEQRALMRVEIDKDFAEALAKRRAAKAKAPDEGKS